MKILFAVAFLSGIVSVYARPVQVISPEDRFKMADYVITATPIAIKETNEVSTIQLNQQSPITYLRKIDATLAIQKCLKGNIDGVIPFEFSVIDYNAKDTPQIYVNGADRIGLQKGTTYLFYLEKHENDYTGILESEFDSAPSVVEQPGNDQGFLLGSQPVPSGERDLDLRGFKPGSRIKDPYTRQIYLVPEKNVSTKHENTVER